MKNITLVKSLELSGFLLWTLTIFLREIDITQNKIVSFLSGIAPNFAVGLIIPALIIKYYPTILKKEIIFKHFILMLIGSYVLLFVSEVIHEKFFNSKIDFYDMIASLIAFGIMVLSYKYHRRQLKQL